jgi:cytochrome P450
MAMSGVVVADPTKIAPFDDPSSGDSDFDLNDLKTRGFDRVTQSLFDEPHLLFWSLRHFWPIPTFRNWALVTRCDDVREVLEHDDVFHVPFTEKVKTLNGGPNFLLGMQRSEEYWRYQNLVMQAFRRDDVAKIVASLAAQFSQDIVSSAPNRLDAVEGLITRVPVLICERYYGIPIPNEIKTAFGHWTIAMSTYTFGNGSLGSRDPSDNERYRRAAVAGADRVRAVVDNAIANAKKTTPSDDTVLARLLMVQKNGATDLTDVVIRAFLIGMITGFVPTNTMAAGHMLEMLLRKRNKLGYLLQLLVRKPYKFMAPTRAAALAGDDDRLMRCLFEAMRFMPLNPGPFRVCRKDYTIAAGTRRAKTIKAGTKLLAGTESAMFDGRRVNSPRTFNPDRPPTDYMLFGHGLHWCVGALIARAQITQTLKVLLVKKGLRRARGKAGKLQRIGPFPAHLEVEFDS